MLVFTQGVLAIISLTEGVAGVDLFEACAGYESGASSHICHVLGVWSALSCWIISFVEGQVPPGLVTHECVHLAPKEGLVMQVRPVWSPRTYESFLYVSMVLLRSSPHHKPFSYIHHRSS